LNPIETYTHSETKQSDSSVNSNNASPRSSSASHKSPPQPPLPPHAFSVLKAMLAKINKLLIEKLVAAFSHWKGIQSGGKTVSGPVSPGHRKRKRRPLRYRLPSSHSKTHIRSPFAYGCSSCCNSSSNSSATMSSTLDSSFLLSPNSHPFESENTPECFQLSEDPDGIELTFIGNDPLPLLADNDPPPMVSGNHLPPPLLSGNDAPVLSRDDPPPRSPRSSVNDPPTQSGHGKPPISSGKDPPSSTLSATPSTIPILPKDNPSSEIRDEENRYCPACTHANRTSDSECNICLFPLNSNP